MGQRIHDKRKECGLTMEELGAKLGVLRQTVWKWENAKVKNIDRIYIKAMAEIFHCTPDWLMGFEKDDEVTVTYSAPGREPVTANVTGTPIIGASSTSPKAELLQAVLDVKPENYAIAIKLLKSLS